MSRPWFRMYHEFVSDPKVQLLAFEDQRHFVALLCLKCNETLDSKVPTELRERMIAKALGLDPASAAEVKRRLIEAGLIKDTWQPKQWDSRQFESDTSSARTAAYRQRLKNKSHGDAAVTSQERTRSDTDTDTEQIKRPQKRPSRRVPEDFKPDLDFATKTIPDIDATTEAAKFKDWEFKTPRSDWDACWRTWIRNAKDRQSYAKKSSGNGLEGVKWQ